MPYRRRNPRTVIIDQAVLALAVTGEMDFAHRRCRQREQGRQRVVVVIDGVHVEVVDVDGEMRFAQAVGGTEREADAVQAQRVIAPHLLQHMQVVAAVAENSRCGLPASRWRAAPRENPGNAERASPRRYRVCALAWA